MQVTYQRLSYLTHCNSINQVSLLMFSYLTYIEFLLNLNITCYLFYYFLENFVQQMLSFSTDRLKIFTFVISNKKSGSSGIGTHIDAVRITGRPKQCKWHFGRKVFKVFRVKTRNKIDRPYGTNLSKNW